MKQKASLYNTSHVEEIITISSRADKLGNIYFYVEYVADGSKRYCRFSAMSSVLDFVKSNF